MADRESTESVLLQCTSSGDVEDGEEVARAEESRMVFTPTDVEFAKKYAAKVNAATMREDDVVDRRSGDVRAWLSNCVDDSAYWNSGGRVRTRRRTEAKGFVEDLCEGLVVGKSSAKRKLEESRECAQSESELDEGGTDSSDAESAAADASSSSSESDASEREDEEISGRCHNKRRRVVGDESVHLKFGSRTRRPSLRQDQSSIIDELDAVECDHEFKEMQVLLDLQLKASERREAGVKQRMESMMDLMTRHMGLVEKRVAVREVEVEPQEQVLERISVKLEKVMEGFSALNENLSILSAALSRDFESQ